MLPPSLEQELTYQQAHSRSPSPWLRFRPPHQHLGTGAMPGPRRHRRFHAHRPLARLRFTGWQTHANTRRDVRKSGKRSIRSRSYTTTCTILDSPGEYVIHCALMWQRQHRGFIGKKLDFHSLGYRHTLYCSRSFVHIAGAGEEKSDPLDRIAIKTWVGLSDCEVEI